jgi:hypothetical protein
MMNAGRKDTGRLPKAAQIALRALAEAIDEQGTTPAAYTHTAAMAVMARIGGGHGSDRSVATMAAAASRLIRANAAQLEVYRRLKNGGSQFVRVEHVHVNFLTCGLSAPELPATSSTSPR